MILKNGFVYLPDHRFARMDLELCEGRIARVAAPDSLSGDAFDAGGAYILPGFVDIHIHGAAGSDFCDGTEADFLKIASYLGSQGVTSFLGTSMAFDEPTLTDIFAEARRFIGRDAPGCAVMRGINMEGPFFSKAKKGAQSEKYIVDPDYGMFVRLQAASGGGIRLVDLAPELPGALEFIRKAKDSAVVSIAHTTANFDQAAAAFAAGATHTTHLFNAMPPFGHRDPGVIGAAADSTGHIELISDGIHIHPSMVRSVFRLFGDDRVCLISDAMRACGMPDGDYTLGGQDVHVQTGKATLADGTIAGSATCLADCFRRAVSFGVPLESAARAATENPARAVGLYDQVGGIEPGKRADLVLLAPDLSLRRVLIGGR